MGAQENAPISREQGNSGADPRADEQSQGGGSCRLCQAVSELEKVSRECKSSESTQNKTKPNKNQGAVNVTFRP